MRLAPLAATIGAGFSLSLSAMGSPAVATRPAYVVVLAILHQLHATTPYYGFDDLTRIIEDLDPAVLLVELTAEDLDERKEQQTKQEYQRLVYPLLERRRYEAVPLEPPQPEFSRLVGLMRQAHADTSERAPEADQRFGAYAEALLDVLLAHWDSPAAVNSRLTDRLFEAKHALQNELYGENEAAVWAGWNAHFLRTILDTARRHPGERLLVLVGAEHGYWLRRELRGEESIRLLDAEELLEWTATRHPAPQPRYESWRRATDGSGEPRIRLEHPKLTIVSHCPSAHSASLGLNLTVPSTQYPGLLTRQQHPKIGESGGQLRKIGWACLILQDFGRV